MLRGGGRQVPCPVHGTDPNHIDSIKLSSDSRVSRVPVAELFRAHHHSTSAEYLARLIESNRLCIRIAEEPISDVRFVRKFLTQIMPKMGRSRQAASHAIEGQSGPQCIELDHPSCCHPEKSDQDEQSRCLAIISSKLQALPSRLEPGKSEKTCSPLNSDIPGFSAHRQKNSQNIN